MRLYSCVLKNDVTNGILRSDIHRYRPLSLNVRGENEMVRIVVLDMVIALAITGAVLPPSSSILTHVTLGVIDKAPSVVTVQVREKS